MCIYICSSDQLLIIYSYDITRGFCFDQQKKLEDFVFTFMVTNLLRVFGKYLSLKSLKREIIQNNLGHSCLPIFN